MLDKLDEHVPVYKVVDKVDQVVPSFALFIIIIIILLLLIGIGIFGIINTLVVCAGLAFLTAFIYLFLKI